MRVMRYVIALMFMWGGIQYSYAQNDQNNTEVDCPPALNEEGTSQEEITDDPFVRGNEDAEIEYEYETDDAELQIEKEDGKVEYDYEDDQTELQMESEDAARLEDCPNGEGASMDGEAGADPGITTYETYETTEVVYVPIEEERERSTFGKIWRAPFKAIGNVPRAAVSLVSESAEGVGHIVGAPFKAVGKLFGAEEDDNDDFVEADNM